MRQSWTDDRLDEFRLRVDERFDEVDRRFDEVDRRFEEVDRRFEGVDRRFDRLAAEMDRRFERVETEMKDGNKALRADFAALRKENHALQITMIRVGGALFVALMGLVLVGQV